METFLKDKKLYIAILILLSVISLFFIVKFINEIKSNKYIGRSSESPSVIRVSGKGKVKATPDIANLNITISKDATTAKEAQKLLNKTVTNTLNYLKKTIADKDINSQYGGISPKYSYKNRTTCTAYPCPPVGNPKIIGYTASQTIKVKVREVDNANKIRTDLSGFGITNITGPDFSIDDPTVYQDEARAIAIKKAKENAITLAKELGVRLGSITNFSESNNSPRPILYGTAMASLKDASAESAPQLPKGETTITSNVTITYQLK